MVVRGSLFDTQSVDEWIISVIPRVDFVSNAMHASSDSELLEKFLYFFLLEERLVEYTAKWLEQSKEEVNAFDL